MVQQSGTFLNQFCGFAGPGRGIINRGGDNQIILPPTQGDATVVPTEQTFEVTFDETGNTPREVFSIGQRVEVTYPMKYADLEVFAMAATGDNYVLVNTEDPDGSGASYPLTARKSAKNNYTYVHKKTPFALDIVRLSDGIFDFATGDPMARTVDQDLFGVHIPNAVALAPEGSIYTWHNQDSPYTMRFLGVSPIGITNEYWRLFNIDLDLAS